MIMKKTEFDLHGENLMKLSWLLSNGQVVMLTCCNAQKSVNGIIVLCWMTPTSHEPLLLTVSVGNGVKGDMSYRACYSLINETKEFGLNVPTTKLVDAITKAGTTHSDEVDKFAETGLTPIESRKISAPLIGECFLNIECKVLEQFVTGDHTVFVAEPVAAYMDDDLIVDGKFSEKYLNKSNQVQICEIITMFNMW
jgi:flavin reductase (DIM6/NTAB) family NADH-FMN oxidoreductase RutF